MLHKIGVAAEDILEEMEEEEEEEEEEEVPDGDGGDGPGTPRGTKGAGQGGCPRASGSPALGSSGPSCMSG